MFFFPPLCCLIIRPANNGSLQWLKSSRKTKFGRAVLDEVERIKILPAFFLFKGVFFCGEEVIFLTFYCFFATLIHDFRRRNQNKCDKRGCARSAQYTRLTYHQTSTFTCLRRQPSVGNNFECIGEARIGVGLVLDIIFVQRTKTIVVQLSTPTR